MGRHSHGFTLIEVATAIVIIGILITVGSISFWAVQRDSRDSIREVRATILAEAMEKYYETHGEYPACADLTVAAATVTSNTLKGIDPEVLKAPNGPANSITCTEPTAGQDAYYYNEGSGRLSWTLQYMIEAENGHKTIQSRRT